MRFYFVRHAQTEYNLKNAYYGQTDIGLTNEGRRQAGALAVLLKNVVWKEIWQSDLKRVQQTVDILCGGKEKTVSRRFEALREMDFGKWEGLTYNEVTALYKEDARAWASDWRGAAPTGGECFDAFYKRAAGCFNRLIKEYGDGDGQILVVAHNGTLRILFAEMLGLGEEGTWHFNFEQDAYSVVDYEYDNFTIRKINSREPVER